MVGSVGAKVEEEGEIAVPAKIFADILSNLTSETVVLESKKEGLSVKTENFNASLNGMNTSDFPIIPDSLKGNSTVIKGEDFFKALEKVIFSVSRDDTRPILTGVLFMFKGDLLVLVSSDGFRLSQKKINLKPSVKENSFILPRTILTEIPRLSEKDGKVEMELRSTENQVVFGFGNMVLGSRVIEGDFPNFEKIIPKSPKVKIHVSREELLQAVKLASIFARDAANVVKIEVKKEGVSFSAESSRSGSQKMEVPGKVEGELMSVSYNCRFIEEFLNVAEGEEVEMELTDSTSPGIFRDTKDPEFFHLVMPVRVGA